MHAAAAAGFDKGFCESRTGVSHVQCYRAITLRLQHELVAQVMQLV